jgi:hypothetical protein
VVQAAVSGKANLLIFSIKIFDSVLLFGKCWEKNNLEEIEHFIN